MNIHDIFECEGRTKIPLKRNSMDVGHPIPSIISHFDVHLVVLLLEAPLSRYHTLPINDVTMHAMRVKSNSNFEARASPIAPPQRFFLTLLCGNFVE